MGFSKFARRIVGLQAVFPSSDRSVPSPDSLDGTVSPVYLFPSSPASLDRVQRAQDASASVVTPVLNLGFIGQGFYEEWLYASIFHNSVTPTVDIVFNLIDPAGAGVQLARLDVDAADARNVVGECGVGNLAAGTRSERRNRVWIPPGFQVVVTGATLGAPYVITLQRLLVVHPIAEPPVWP